MLWNQNKWEEGRKFAKIGIYEYLNFPTFGGHFAAQLKMIPGGALSPNKTGAKICKSALETMHILPFAKSFDNDYSRVLMIERCTLPVPYKEFISCQNASV